jgi:hypothetical protein
LVVCGVPTPKQFVEFAMATCYPEVYRAHRLDADHRYRDVAHYKESKRVDMVPAEPACFEVLTHIRVPGF